MPTLHEIVRERRFNFYDAFNAVKQSGTFLLFGPANVGDLYRTNLASPPGVLEPTAENFIDHWYARADLGNATLLQRAAFERWSHWCPVTMRVGDMPQEQFSLFDLLRRKPWFPPSVATTQLSPEELAAFYKRQDEGARPIHVPLRQTFAIEVLSTHIEHELLADAFQAFDGDHGRFPTVWIHIEGIQREVL